jgi:hypothetical protein
MLPVISFASLPFYSLLISSSSLFFMASIQAFLLAAFAGFKNGFAG